MLLRVRGGELESGRQWVYAWLARDGVLYVGATALHPETRTWLHLHHDDPEIGRMRARFAALAAEELDVVAVELPEGVDRQQVRHVRSRGSPSAGCSRSATCAIPRSRPLRTPRRRASSLRSRGASAGESTPPGRGLRPGGRPRRGLRRHEDGHPHGGEHAPLWEPIETGFWLRVRIDTVRSLDQQYRP